MLDEFDRIRTVSTLLADETAINLLRQAFLSLATAFEAAIFDLVRAALYRHFFKLIPSFGRNERILIKNLPQYNSAESFQSQVIEDQLKTVYIRELLFALGDLNVKMTAKKKDFVRLIEMVMRRNIHIHNRGRVDERYVEKNSGGVSNFNLDGLKVGDMAPITPEYWDRANTLYLECVERVAIWADT